MTAPNTDIYGDEAEYERRKMLLAREIRAQVNGLRNALDTRRAHPTYGVTKRSLWARYGRLVGTLYGYLVMTGHHHADVELGAVEAGEMLGIDVRQFVRLIGEC